MYNPAPKYLIDLTNIYGNENKALMMKIWLAIVTCEKLAYFLKICMLTLGLHKSSRTVLKKEFISINRTSIFLLI